jgi:hypothetical protein
MMSEIDFETYLFLNKKKLVICVIHKKSFEIIYLDQLILNDNHYKFNFEKINEFLEKNIFKVERILNNFVKNIYIILDSDDFFSVKLSIKKNNNGNYINSNSLLHPLNDLKNSCQSNFDDKKIIHMLVENYIIDNKNYISLPKNLKCNFFSLDVEFICLSKNIIKDIEIVLKKYHILISQILSASYIESFIDEDQQNIFTTASRIKSGLNENEVLLVSKTHKNKGFFEKFFDFFN